MNRNFAFRSFSNCPFKASSQGQFSTRPTLLQIPLKSFSTFSISQMMGINECSPFNSFQQIRGLKIGVSITRRCEHCYIVIRNGIRYVYCKVNPRHKRRQG